MSKSATKSFADLAKAGTDAVLPSAEIGSTAAAVSAPLPRPQRRKRRSTADRGLPPDEDLAGLATAYLERQRQGWPAIVKAGLLPEMQLNVIAEMVDSFKQRHRSGKVDVEAVRPFLQYAKLGGDYNRYSCENSNPHSILDQMVKALDKARAEDRFIPWEYLFADYSVTGLDATRQGYSSYKAVLEDPTHFIETTYIDDFSRASRAELEWWKLAALTKRLQKRLIGASDGFDLSRPESDVMITIYGLVSRLFIKGLREKVRRGMRGAARRKTILGKLSLGFTRRAKLNADGAAICGPDGTPVYERCIDPDTAKARLLMYELFVEKGWTAFKIKKHFNHMKVDGWAGWTESAIKRLLRSPDAIGVFIWNRTHQDYDFEAEKIVTVKNPRSEWEVDFQPSLAIVPLDLWRAARRKLAAMRRASPLTGKQQSRNQNTPTTLFSGVLFCEDCGEELKLIRSAGKYKQMGCLNGVNVAHDCRMSSSKSVAEIETCLLGFLRETLLNEEHLDSVVASAKRYVEEEAKKPTINVEPLKVELRQKEVAIKRLVKKVESTDDDALSEGYDKRIKELQREVNTLNASIREANARNRKSVPELDDASVRGYLRDLRGVLEQEIPVAAEALRQLTGPITIRHEPIAGKKNRARWIATFSPDLVRLLQHVTSEGPQAAQPFVSQISNETVEVVIQNVAKYEQLAPKFKLLRDDGASPAAIAASHGMTRKSVHDILRFADTGERPIWKSGRKTGNGGNATRYKSIATEVVQLRDEKRMSFSAIAKQLEVSTGTVQRAYDFGSPEAARTAMKDGKRVSRGTYTRLGDEKFKRICELLDAGISTDQVANKVGCGVSTIYRAKKAMASKQD